MHKVIMATSTPNTEYVCTLSEARIKQAEEELNEKPQWRSRDIQALRDMVLKKPELKIRTDDAFLLRFLRAKKFDYDRAFNLLVRHYEMKADEKNKSLFLNLRPASIKHVLEAGVTGVLPHRDKLGRRVIMFRPGRWDPSKYPIDDIFRTNFLTLTTLLEEEEEIQICGIILLADLKHMGWKQTKKIKPFYAKKMFKAMEDCFPMRFKGIHYLNEPAVFDYIFAIMKPFLKEKILSRVHFHGNKYHELKEYIDEEHLPSDYGGQGPPFSNEDWMKTLMDSDSHFDSEAKYCLVKSTGKSETSKETTVDCLAGSYRNLDIE
ncbi:alpha-tocopherol transfer protein-like isoform X1 [Dreissena polymorpha]|uniref:alpha-tocopherol transfer protein-like isoform X1 n=1 Tax=Dreissena polymorpha TaxID=45954 RepID=UPI002264499F|nr:alpha-tocopherol transfer protein-like isoform X1 [Dreissena polymorpha]